MGQRSRKRRDAPASRAASRADRPPAPPDASSAARSAAPRADRPPAPRNGDRIARGYPRGRERDAAARAALRPLAPGERPLAVTLAAILAALLGAANVVLLLAGWDVRGDSGDEPLRVFGQEVTARAQEVAGTVFFAGLLLAAAIGMWRCRYWAVLGFEALLGISIVFAALSLMVASNLTAVLLCVAIIAIAAPLFWFLIRAMARIQLPSRRPQHPVG